MTDISGNSTREHLTPSARAGPPDTTSMAIWPVLHPGANARSTPVRSPRTAHRTGGPDHSHTARSRRDQSRNRTAHRVHRHRQSGTQKTATTVRPGQSLFRDRRRCRDGIQCRRTHKDGTARHNALVCTVGQPSAE
nr:hypothetical protein [Kibdelosporangium sp. MJ126-NF4]